MNNMLKRFFLFALIIVGLFCADMQNGSKLYAEEAASIVEISATKWFNGKSFSLEANKDKIVVLEFWASWCPPCRFTIPHLKEMSDKYKKSGVAFVSLTSETNYDALQDFCIDNNMTWTIGFGSGSFEDYNIVSVPYAFIIADGAIKWQGHPMMGMDKVLEEMVAAKAK